MPNQRLILEILYPFLEKNSKQALCEAYPWLFAVCGSQAYQLCQYTATIPSELSLLKINNNTLRVVDLSFKRWLTSAHVHTLLTGSPHLTHLRIEGCPLLDDSIFVSIALTKLTHLSFSIPIIRPLKFQRMVSAIGPTLIQLRIPRYAFEESYYKACSFEILFFKSYDEFKQEFLALCNGPKQESLYSIVMDIPVILECGFINNDSNSKSSDRGSFNLLSVAFAYNDTALVSHILNSCDMAWHSVSFMESLKVIPYGDYHARISNFSSQIDPYFQFLASGQELERWGIRCFRKLHLMQDPNEFKPHSMSKLYRITFGLFLAVLPSPIILPRFDIYTSAALPFDKQLRSYNQKLDAISIITASGNSSASLSMFSAERISGWAVAILLEVMDWTVSDLKFLIFLWSQSADDDSVWGWKCDRTGDTLLHLFTHISPSRLQDLQQEFISPQCVVMFDRVCKMLFDSPVLLNEENLYGHTPWQLAFRSNFTQFILHVNSVMPSFAPPNDLATFLVCAQHRNLYAFELMLSDQFAYTPVTYCEPIIQISSFITRENFVSGYCLHLLIMHPAALAALVTYCEKNLGGNDHRSAKLKLLGGLEYSALDVALICGAPTESILCLLSAGFHTKDQSWKVYFSKMMADIALSSDEHDSLLKLERLVCILRPLSPEFVRDISSIMNSDESLVHFLARWTSTSRSEVPDLLSRLLSCKDFDLNAVDHHRDTVMHLLARYSPDSTIFGDLIRDQGANLAILNSSRQSVLHVFCEWAPLASTRFADIVDDILQHSSVSRDVAAITGNDSSNRSPWTIALLRNHISPQVENSYLKCVRKKMPTKQAEEIWIHQCKQWPEVEIQGQTFTLDHKHAGSYLQEFLKHTNFQINITFDSMTGLDYMLQKLDPASDISESTLFACLDYGGRTSEQIRHSAALQLMNNSSLSENPNPTIELLHRAVLLSSEEEWKSVTQFEIDSVDSKGRSQVYNLCRTRPEIDPNLLIHRITLISGQAGLSRMLTICDFNLVTPIMSSLFADSLSFSSVKDRYLAIDNEVTISNTSRAVLHYVRDVPTHRCPTTGKTAAFQLLLKVYQAIHLLKIHEVSICSSFLGTIARWIHWQDYQVNAIDQTGHTIVDQLLSYEPTLDPSLFKILKAGLRRLGAKTAQSLFEEARDKLNSESSILSLEPTPVTSQLPLPVDSLDLVYQTLMEAQNEFDLSEKEKLKTVTETGLSLQCGSALNIASSLPLSAPDCTQEQILHAAPVDVIMDRTSSDLGYEFGEEDEDTTCILTDLTRNVSESAVMSLPRDIFNDAAAKLRHSAYAEPIRASAAVTRSSVSPTYNRGLTKDRPVKAERKVMAAQLPVESTVTPKRKRSETIPNGVEIIDIDEEPDFPSSSEMMSTPRSVKKSTIYDATRFTDFRHSIGTGPSTPIVLGNTFKAVKKATDIVAVDDLARALTNYTAAGGSGVPMKSVISPARLIDIPEPDSRTHADLNIDDPKQIRCVGPIAAYSDSLARYLDPDIAGREEVIYSPARERTQEGEMSFTWTENGNLISARQSSRDVDMVEGEYEDYHLEDSVDMRSHNFKAELKVPRECIEDDPHAGSIAHLNDRTDDDLMITKCSTDRVGDFRSGEIEEAASSVRHDQNPQYELSEENQGLFTACGIPPHEATICALVRSRMVDLDAANEHNQHPIHIWCLSMFVVRKHTKKDCAMLGFLTDPRNAVTLLNHLDNFLLTPLTIMLLHDVQSHPYRNLSSYRRNLSRALQISPITSKIIQMGANLGSVDENGRNSWHGLCLNLFSNRNTGFPEFRSIAPIHLLLLAEQFIFNRVNLNSVDSSGMTGLQLLKRRAFDEHSRDISRSRIDEVNELIDILEERVMTDGSKNCLY